MKIFSEISNNEIRKSLNDEAWKLLRLRNCEEILKLHHCFDFGNRLHVVLDYSKGENLDKFISNHKGNKLKLMKTFGNQL